MACEPSGFVYLDFSRSTLVQSNLGGQGGRCSQLGLCATPAAQDSALEHLLLRDVGRVRRDAASDADGFDSDYLDDRVHLRDQQRAGSQLCVYVCECVSVRACRHV